MRNLTERREAVIDWVNLGLAVILFISPWLFGFAGERPAAWTAWASAVAIAVIAVAAILAFAQWEEWVNLVLGLWVVLAPWVLGFASVASALWSHLVLGVLVAALAAGELWLTRQSPPRVTA